MYHQKVIIPFRHTRLTLARISVFFFFLLISGCAFPDPFEFNVPTAPVIAGYSDGQKIFLSIDGEYIPNELPNFSGFNIYIGDNNEVAEIEKRLLYVSSRDNTPSVSINLSGTSFPTNLEFTGSFAFRLTSKAKEVDQNDEGVTGTEELIENKAAWTVTSAKNFYFVVKAIAKEKTSIFSGTLKIGVPEVSTEDFIIGTAKKISLGGEEINVTFHNTAVGQSVKFQAVSSANTVVENISIGPAPDWQQRALPREGFTQTDPIYGENYVFFVQLKKGTSITHYLKLRVTEINTTSVVTVIHSFIN